MPTLHPAAYSRPAKVLTLAHYRREAQAAAHEAATVTVSLHDLKRALAAQGSLQGIPPTVLAAVAGATLRALAQATAFHPLRIELGNGQTLLCTLETSSGAAA